MQNAFELTKVFSSPASSHLVIVTAMHKQVAGLKALLLCRSGFDCRTQKSNSAAHLSSRCYLALRKTTRLLNLSPCCTMLVMVLLPCGTLSDLMLYVRPHLKCCGGLMKLVPTDPVSASDGLVFVLHLTPFSLGH